MNYSTKQFLDIIDALQARGVEFIREEEEDGIKLRLYHNPQKNLIKIDASDDDMHDSTGKSYLTLLGLSDLIPAMFPQKIEEPVVIGKFTGKTFSFAGLLPTLSTEKAKELVECNGGKFCDSLSPTLNYLVAGSDADGEIETAKDLAINVLNEAEFLSMAR